MRRTIVSAAPDSYHCIHSTPFICTSTRAFEHQSTGEPKHPCRRAPTREYDHQKLWVICFGAFLLRWLVIPVAWQHNRRREGYEPHKMASCNLFQASNVSPVSTAIQILSFHAIFPIQFLYIFWYHLWWISHFQLYSFFPTLLITSLIHLWCQWFSFCLFFPGLSYLYAMQSEIGWSKEVCWLPWIETSAGLHHNELGATSPNFPKFNFKVENWTFEFSVAKYMSWNLEAAEAVFFKNHAESDFKETFA